MGVKINSRIITKNHSADAQIGFLTKSISKPYGHLTAIPKAWESNSGETTDSTIVESLERGAKITNFTIIVESLI